VGESGNQIAVLKNIVELNVASLYLNYVEAHKWFKDWKMEVNHVVRRSNTVKIKGGVGSWAIILRTVRKTSDRGEYCEEGIL
jgi:hypothetical protein